MKLFLLFVLIPFFVSCSSSHKETKTPEPSAQEALLKASAERSHRIPPSSCRLIGTIVSIDDSLADNPKDPCGKTPCRALVRVDSVLGYGQGFAPPLAEGNEIKITFKFTLNPTDDLFPNMNKAYPGLSVGDAFVANVEALRTGMSPKDAPQFLVYGYKKKSN